MKHHRKKIAPILGLFIIFSIHVFGQNENPKVRITESQADVHLWPDLSSKVLEQVPAGTELEYMDKVNEWYRVYLPHDESGIQRLGYIHQKYVKDLKSVIDEPVTPTKARAAEAQPQAIQRRQEPPLETPPSGVKPKDWAQIKKVEKSIRKQSIAFLTLVKRMKPVKSEELQLSSVDMARTVLDRCPVFDVMDVSSRVIYTARINEEFEILEKKDSFYRIRLKDGREGWIQEECIQVFAAQKQEPKVVFKGVESSEAKSFLEVSEKIFSEISRQKILADHIIKKYKDPNTGAPLGPKEIHDVYARIEKYYSYALRFYEDFVENRAILFEEKVSILSKLSAWTEILMGSSDFTTEYLNLDDEKSKGMIRDISAGGSLALSESSQIQVGFSNKKDILQTPYSTTDINVGYAFSKENKFHINTGINYAIYNDEFNDLNNFNRILLTVNTNYKFSDQMNFLFNYSFLDNSFIEDEINNYKNHNFLATLNLLNSPRSRFVFRFHSILESSDSDYHKFTNLMPSISYETRGADSRTNVRFLYDSLNYTETDMSDYGRYSLYITRRKGTGGVYNNLNLALTSKSFPGNDIENYLQIRGRYSAAKSGKLNFHFSPSFYTNLFPNNTTNSFTDFRFDMGGTSRSLFGNLSSYFRFWHKPDNEEEEEPMKHHVLDLLGKIGLNIYSIKIGPTAGMHILISSEKGVEFFKRDGNVIRFGGVVEGRLSLPKGISFSFNASYEYGFVYSSQIAISKTEGLLRGELYERHPTTLQVNSSLNVPIMENLELMSRLNYYQIATDMVDEISTYAVSQNKRFTIIFGLRYRHN